MPRTGDGLDMDVVASDQQTKYIWRRIEDGDEKDQDAGQRAGPPGHRQSTASDVPHAVDCCCVGVTVGLWAFDGMAERMEGCKEGIDVALGPAIPLHTRLYLRCGRPVHCND